MARELPLFLTLREAATRAMRTYETVRRWIDAGFLPIVDQPCSNKFGRRYVILAADLEVCIAKAERLIPKGPDDRRVPARPWAGRKRQRTKEWLKTRTPEQKEARRLAHREYYRTRYVPVQQCLKELERGQAPAGPSSPVAPTKSRSSKPGKKSRRRTRSKLRRGGANGRRPSRLPCPASSDASPST